MLDNNHHNYACLQLHVVCTIIIGNKERETADETEPATYQGEESSSEGERPSEPAAPAVPATGSATKRKQGNIVFD